MSTLSTEATNDTAPLSLAAVAIDTYRENVAYLHRDCPVYQAEGFQALAKVRVQLDGISVLAVLNVVDDTGIVDPTELGLSEQAFTQLGAAVGSRVRIEHAEPPQSMESVKRKMNGERLGREELAEIVLDITHNRYSKVELTAFVVAASHNGLDREEVLSLTHAMVDSGTRLDWGESLVADKHCIGGIPGNRTSLIVVPIVAAHGMLIPKTSSRAITSPAGTADTMEVMAAVDLGPEALREVALKHRGCLGWGGRSDLAPADDVLISVERPLSIDSREQMVASILAKKLAAGSTHLLLDIPIGPTAKIRDQRAAMALRKLFEYVGDRCGINVEVVITDGRQPIGNGVGPVLEARDAMHVLESRAVAPVDLRERSLQLAGRILEFDPDVRGGQGYVIARDILDSGRALERMNDIIEAQGKREPKSRLGALTETVPAPVTGRVESIDCFRIARIARLAGAPLSKGAGVDLFAKIGERVTVNEPLYRVHAEYRAGLNFACSELAKNSGYVIVED